MLTSCLALSELDWGSARLNHFDEWRLASSTWIIVVSAPWSEHALVTGFEGATLNPNLHRWFTAGLGIQHTDRTSGLFPDGPGSTRKWSGAGAESGPEQNPDRLDVSGQNLFSICWTLGLSLQSLPFCTTSCLWSNQLPSACLTLRQRSQRQPSKRRCWWRKSWETSPQSTPPPSTLRWARRLIGCFSSAPVGSASRFNRHFLFPTGFDPWPLQPGDEPADDGSVAGHPRLPCPQTAFPTLHTGQSAVRGAEGVFRRVCGSLKGNSSGCLSDSFYRTFWNSFFPLTNWDGSSWCQTTTKTDAIVTVESLFHRKSQVEIQWDVSFCRKTKVETWIWLISTNHLLPAIGWDFFLD